MSVRFIVLRHGQYVSGNKQALTPDSSLRCRIKGERLADKFGVADVIYSSEILKAKATAELVAQGMNYPVKGIEATTNLSELSSMPQVTYLLHSLTAEAAVKEYQNIVLVTHLPVIEKLTSYFTGETAFVKPENGVIIEADSWNNILDGRPRFSLWD